MPAQCSTAFLLRLVVIEFASCHSAAHVQAMVEGVDDPGALRSIADGVLSDIQCLNEIYSQGVPEGLVRAETEKYLPQISTFVRRHLLRNEAPQTRCAYCHFTTVVLALIEYQLIIVLD